MKAVVCEHCGAPVVAGAIACAYCGVAFAAQGAARPDPGRPTSVNGAPAAVIAELQRGNKIAAIKAWRDHFGSGLKEAKDAVEALEARMRGGPARR